MLGLDQNEMILGGIAVLALLMAVVMTVNSLRLSRRLKMQRREMQEVLGQINHAMISMTTASKVVTGEIERVFADPDSMRGLDRLETVRAGLERQHEIISSLSQSARTPQFLLKDVLPVLDKAIAGLGTNLSLVLRQWDSAMEEANATTASELAEDANQAEADLASLRSEYDGLHKMHENLVTAHREAQATIREMERELARVGSGEAETAVDRGIVDEAIAVRDAIEEELEEMRRQAVVLEAENARLHEQLEAQVAAADNLPVDTSFALAEAPASSEEIEELEKRIEDLEKEIEDLESVNELLLSESADAEENGLREEELEEELNTARNRIDELEVELQNQTALAAPVGGAEVHPDIMRELEELRSYKSRTFATLQELEEMGGDSLKVEMERRDKELKASREEIRKLRDKIKDMRYGQMDPKDLDNEILAQNLKELEEMRAAMEIAEATANDMATARTKAMQQLTEERAEYKAEKEKLIMQISELELAAMETAMEAAPDQRAEVQSLKNQVAELKGQLQKASTENNRLAMILEASQKSQRGEEAQAEASVDPAELERLQRDLEAIGNDRDALAEENRELDERIEELIQTLEARDAAPVVDAADVSILREELEAARAEIDTLSAVKNALAEEARQATEGLAAYQQAREELERGQAAEMDQARGELEEALETVHAEKIAAETERDHALSEGDALREQLEQALQDNQHLAEAEREQSQHNQGVLQGQIDQLLQDRSQLEALNAEWERRYDALAEQVAQDRQEASDQLNQRQESEENEIRRREEEMLRKIANLEKELEEEKRARAEALAERGLKAEEEQDGGATLTRSREEMEAILRQGPGRADLRELDMLREQLKRAQEINKNLRTELDEAHQAFPEMDTPAASEERLQREREERLREQAAHAAVVAELNRELENARAAIEAQTHGPKPDETEAADERVAALQKRIDELESIAGIEPEELEEVQAALDGERMAREEERRKATEHQAALQKRIDELESIAGIEPEELEQVQNALDGERMAREEERRKAAEQQAALQKRIDELESVPGIEPEELEQAQVDLDRERIAREEERRQMMNELATLREQIEQLREDNASLADRFHAATQEENDRLSQTQALLSQTQKQREELQQEFEALNKELEVARLADAQAREQLRQLDASRPTPEQLSETQTALNNEQQQRLRLQAEIESLQGHMGSLENEKWRLTDQLERARAGLNELRPLVQALGGTPPALEDEKGDEPPSPPPADR